MANHFFDKIASSGHDDTPLVHVPGGDALSYGDVLRETIKDTFSSQE